MIPNVTGPTVDIIIPVFNRLVFLGATIDSVLRQSFTNWRLFIVDDGSTEDVTAFLQKYTPGTVTLIRQPNQGNAAARNAGIAVGRSPYVACLDSDDIWHPHMLESCVAVLESQPSTDVVFTQFQSVDEHERLLPVAVGPEPRAGSLLPALLMGYPILPSSALVRRTCFVRWGSFTPGLDDWELWLRWAASGCQFDCVAQPLLSYRVHNQNFNLDWDRRRHAHFAMLDHFFVGPAAAVVAFELRAKAYANQHLYFAELAWELDRPADAQSEFVRAVLAETQILVDPAVYYRLACAHQGRIDAGTSRNLDLTTAERTVIGALGALFAEPDLPAAIRTRRAQAVSTAYLGLARVAYGVAHNTRRARHFLRRSIVAWPRMAVTRAGMAQLALTLLGYERVQRLKPDRPSPVMEIDGG